jgi:hypothetical protein
MRNTTATSFDASKPKRYVWVYVLSALMLAAAFGLLANEFPFMFN